MLATIRKFYCFFQPLDCVRWQANLLITAEHSQDRFGCLVQLLGGNSICLSNASTLGVGICLRPLASSSYSASVGIKSKCSPVTRSKSARFSALISFEPHDHEDQPTNAIRAVAINAA